MSRRSGYVGGTCKCSRPTLVDEESYAPLLLMNFYVTECVSEFLGWLWEEDVDDEIAVWLLFDAFGFTSKVPSHRVITYALHRYAIMKVNCSRCRRKLYVRMIELMLEACQQYLEVEETYAVSQ